MVTLKTGTLSRLAGELGLLAGGVDEAEAAEYGALMAKIGVGFQILDDVTNLTTGNPGKKRGDDVVEGKKSLPVILHLEKRQGDLGFFADSFAQARKEGIASSAVEAVIGRLAESGAIEDARQYGAHLIESACLSLRGRYPQREQTSLIAGLFESMVARIN